MNNKAWISLFIFTLFVHLASDFLPVSYLALITKPLLMVILLNWFNTATGNISSGHKRWVTLALCFSWLGDVLLMFQDKDSMFFLLGLSAFLIAHLFYIVFFYRVKVAEQLSSKWLVIFIAPYYALLIGTLYPYLGEMKLPVLVYGVVICCMFYLALHMLFLENRFVGRLMAIGALLFVVSDSVLALNKFYQPFESAGIIVMLTYGLSQLLITAGAIQYINESSPATSQAS